MEIRDNPQQGKYNETQKPDESKDSSTVVFLVYIIV